MTVKIDDDAEINSVRLKEQANSPTGTASGYNSLFVKSDGLYVINDSQETIGPFITGTVSTALYRDYVYLVDQKASGTSGGDATAGSWEQRDVTDELTDTGNICSLSSGQFTLDAGTYRCLASAPAFRSGDHQIRLYNTTDASMELLGTSEWSDNTASEAQTRSLIVGRFTIASQKIFEIQHQVAVNRVTNGYGEPNVWGDNIFTTVELWRET